MQRQNPLKRQQLFAEKLAGKSRRAAGRVKRGRELNVVERDDIQAAAYPTQVVEKPAVGKATRLLRSGAGKLRRIEDIEIENMFMN